MPDNFRIGATSSTGVQLNVATTYKSPASGFRGGTNRDFVLTNMIGGPPVLSRHQRNSKSWDWIVYARRAAGHQERLTDLAAIETQLTAAINYSLGDAATAIYLFELYGNQSAVAQYLIIHGWIDEETRLPGGANKAIVAHLHLDTRLAGA